ncbi:hypothetical protein L218DRAFT_702160 [Marasmius fiardii PR-910]|nr:hypothetical protein L218DRAFT_702160 [Marasmius fiardii PR-910]
MERLSFLIASRLLKAHIDICEPYPYSDMGTTPERHPNPILPPDRFFFSLAPVITIRHPVQVHASLLRTLQYFGGDISHLDFPVHAESFWLDRLVFDSFKNSVYEGRRSTVQHYHCGLMVINW